MKTDENKQKSLSSSLSKINFGATEVGATIVAKLESREKAREQMKNRVNKEFDSVRGKPKRNLPV